MKISIIAAIGRNRELGDAGEIPWHISEDFKRFKQITIDHPIIMGRRTFESIGRLLPNRYNIVITRDTEFKINGLRNGAEFIVVDSLGEAMNQVKEILKPVQDDNRKEVFIIGGGQIFEQAMPIVNKLYLTIVEGDFNADTFFPDYSDFKKVISEQKGESDGYKYKFLELEK